MQTLWKALIGIAIALALILAGGLWWLSRSLGPLAASAVRTYGPEITGVSVHLDDVSITPFSGTAELRGLVVGNPEGFHADHALSLGELSAAVSLRSLLGDVIVIKRIVTLFPAGTSWLIFKPESGSLMTKLWGTSHVTLVSVSSTGTPRLTNKWSGLKE